MPGSSVHAEGVAGGSKRPLENDGLGMERVMKYSRRSMLT